MDGLEGGAGTGLEDNQTSVAAAPKSRYSDNIVTPIIYPPQPMSRFKKTIIWSVVITALLRIGDFASGDHVSASVSRWADSVSRRLHSMNMHVESHPAVPREADKAILVETFELKLKYRFGGSVRDYQKWLDSRDWWVKRSQDFIKEQKWLDQQKRGRHREAGFNEREKFYRIMKARLPQKQQLAQTLRQTNKIG